MLFLHEPSKVILSLHFSFHGYFKVAGSDVGQCLGSTCRHGLCMVSKQANQLCRA
jgi:hypothetical protein